MALDIHSIKNIFPENDLPFHFFLGVRDNECYGDFSPRKNVTRTRSFV